MKKPYQILFDTNSDDPIDLADSWTKLQSDLDKCKLYDSRWHPLPNCPVEQIASPHAQATVLSTAVCSIVSKKCAFSSLARSRSLPTVKLMTEKATTATSITTGSATLCSPSTIAWIVSAIRTSLTVCSSPNACLQDMIDSSEGHRFSEAIADFSSAVCAHPVASTPPSPIVRCDFESGLALCFSTSFHISTALFYVDSPSATEYCDTTIPSVRSVATSQTEIQSSIPFFSVLESLSTESCIEPESVLAESRLGIAFSTQSHQSKNLHAFGCLAASGQFDLFAKTTHRSSALSEVLADTSAEIAHIPGVHACHQDNIRSLSNTNIEYQHAPNVAIHDPLATFWTLETTFQHVLSVIQHTTVGTDSSLQNDIIVAHAVNHDAVETVQINPSYKNADFDFNYLAIYSLDEDDFPYTVKGKMTTATKKSQAFTVVEDFEPSNLDD